jgi:hypothetical protein
MISERAIQDVKSAILEFAERNDIDPQVMIAAFADILGLMAVSFDNQFGEESLDARLADFMQRVNDSYQNHRGRKLGNGHAILLPQ